MEKISDEIRKWCADLDSDDILCTTATLYTMADRIDAEMVELPRDADGSTIRVGDMVYGRWVQLMHDRNREMWAEDGKD